MEKRAKDQTVQLRLRIRESLRARLEKDGRRSGISLNAEVERRLEESYLGSAEKVADLRARLEEQRRMFAATEQELRQEHAEIMAGLRALGYAKEGK